jgi:type IV pilus assembly protein PilV
MLGLITNGLKMTSSSNYRTIAAEQLTAMADMINANPSLITSYATPTNPTQSTCLFTNCATTAIPNHEYHLWLANLPLVLPAGAGIVCLDDTPSDGNSSAFACSGTGRPTVKICWNEHERINISGGGSSGTDSSTDTCLSSQL